MKPNPRMSRVLIAQLNADAAALVQGAMPSTEAVQEVARRAQLIVVRYGRNRILYLSRRGRFVNTWLAGPHGTYIGPGGAGFDDQIDWATDGDAL
jgi:hypothetical protein